MNRPRFAFLALIVTSLLCLSFANGQTVTKTSSDTANEELREKAFRLLESLADQLSSLQSAENRARIGSNIAGSLWQHDEKRARALLANVEEDIKLGLQLRDNDQYSRYTFAVFSKLREDTAERIAKHDPELALGFLQRTEPVSETPLPREISEAQQAMNLRLARRVASKNPEVAVKLGKQALSDNFSRELITLLVRVSAKDKQQAQTLYKDIVDKLRESDIVRYWPEWDFTQNLVRNFTPPAADEATYKDLANIILNKALTQGCGNPRTAGDAEHPSFCIYVGGLLPLLEKYGPGQAARLKHWMTEDASRSYSITQSYVELNDLSENGTVDEILALLSKYPQLEGQIYARAMWKAELEGDFELAKKIATNYNGDPMIKGAMESRVKDFSLTTERIEAELAQMQKNLNGVPVVKQVPPLLEFAFYVVPYDRKIALRILNQVDGMVNTLNPGKEQTDYQMKLAMAYCFAKNDRGFAIMESVLPKLNELIEAGAKLNDYDTRYLRDSEWNMTGEGNVGQLLTRLAYGAGYFAW
ncbi:MAG TPA: hypothetical protein VGW58_14525, partial [Pyrinomonadaceae bacterium]|nr:hypothetical protein [Pyrinomonadaceae bacterium]